MRPICFFLALSLAARHQVRAFAPSTSIGVCARHDALAPRVNNNDRPRHRYQNRLQLQASLTKEELSSLTVVELKDLLRDQGCKVSGRKAELVQRLESAFAVDVDVAITDTEEEGVSKSECSSSSSKEQSAMARREQKNKSTPKKKVSAIADANLDEEFDSLFGQFGKPAPAATRATTSNDSGDAPDTDPATDKSSSSTPSESAVVSETGFASMTGIPQPILRQLTKMNIFEPTPIQKESIPVALDGIDVMGLAQTGTGKTLAFGIPLVSKLLDGSDNDARSRRGTLAPKSVSALVLAPTRELANQIGDQLMALTSGTPIKGMVVYGGVRVKEQADKLRNGVHILVATPGRLIDLLDREAITLRNCRFLTLDEADHMLDMGFAPDLKTIVGRLPPQRQTMLFSATMNKSMAEVAKLYLKNPKRIEVARESITADNLTQEVHFVSKMNKMTKLLALMKKHEGDTTLIFGRTKHGCEKLMNRLNYAGVKCTSIHGNKTQPQRDRAIRDFKSGNVKVLVATDVAARGLDIPEVKHVYNYDLPDQAENYVHRIGRTARAGKEGASISFCSEEEVNALADIEEVIGMEIPVASGSPWRRTRDVNRSAKSWSKGKNQNQAKRSTSSARRVYRR